MSRWNMKRRKMHKEMHKVPEAHKARRTAMTVAAAALLIVSQMVGISVVHAQDKNYATTSNDLQPSSNGTQPSSEITTEQKAYFHYEKGCYYLAQWKFPLAEIEFDEAIADKPDLSSAHQRLCLLETLQLNAGRAIAEFMVVVGLADTLPYNLQEKLELNKHACKLHYEAGLELANTHKWDEALPEFQSALSYCPDNAHVIRSQAFAYANLGKYDKAESLYKTSFSLDPSDAFAHADLAVLLSHKGELVQAQGEMAKAVQLAPDAAALHVDLGWMAQARGDISTAEQEFRKAVDISPKHAALWAHLGELLQEQGSKKEALDAYSRALALGATDPADILAQIAKLRVKSS